MRLLCVAIALLLGCSPVPLAQEPWIEASELMEVKSASTKGGALLEQGEAARLRGDSDRALELYRQAGAEFKSRDHGRRFECLLQSERGKRVEAERACERATFVRNSPAARRAHAGALMAGPDPISIEQLARAKLIADKLIEESAQSPYGYAAMCDIARKLGDERMLSLHLNQLRKVAPTHAETRRLERLLAARAAPRGMYVGWTLLALLLLGTAAHALFRLLKKLTPRVASSAALIALLLAAGRVSAAPDGKPSLSEWPIDEADPVSSVPPLAKLNENPLQAGYLLMDLGERADRAEQAGQHLLAAKYFLAIARMVPERATGLARACAAFQRAGNLADALFTCSAALSKPGVRVEDHIRYGELMLSGSAPLTPEQRSDLDAVVQHLRAEKQTAAAERIRCEIAFRADDSKGLADCTTALAKLAPNDPKTISYQWSLALLEKDHGRAQKLIAQAREAGVEADVLEKMQYVTGKTIPVWRRPGIVVPLLVALAVVAVVAISTRRRRPIVAPPTSPNTAPTAP